MTKIKDHPDEPHTRRASRSTFSAEYQPSRREQKIAHAAVPLLLFLGSLLLYLAFRSASFDDFDSYSFALALEHYSLPLQQPHPPGFPIYIALGRVLKFLLGDALTALTTLSALSGAASVVLVFLLGRTIEPRHPSLGLFAALLIALLPVHWLTAEKALSDALGLTAVLLPLWLWARWIRRGASTVPWAPALLSGLAFGVRPQNALPFGFLAVYLLIHARRAFHPFSALAFVAGTLLWLVPTALSMDVANAGDSAWSRLWFGLRDYTEAVLQHAAHVGRADAITGMQSSFFEALRIRWIAFIRTMLEANLGILPQKLASTSAWLIAVAGGFVFVPGLIAAGWQRRRIRWIGLWMLGVVLQILFLETLDRPRLLLPILPPLALLVASGWVRWRLPDGLNVGVILATSLLFLRIGLPWAATLANVPAPPAQATAYVADRYPPDTTVVTAAGSYRAAQVELPQYRHAYLYEFDGEAVERWLSGGNVNHVVIIDRDQFPPGVVETLSAEDRWVPIEDRVFARDRRAHTQHDHVRVQVLTPAPSVPAEALAPDPDGCVDIGGGVDGRYLGAGWFRGEVIGGVEGRWAGGIPTSTIRITLPAGRDYRLRLRGMAYPEGQTVTLRVDGRELDTADLRTQWSVVSLSLPAENLNPEGFTTLTLAHAVAISPAEVTGGTSSDARLLTAAYDWLCATRP
jgi:hypothetical protein